MIAEPPPGDGGADKNRNDGSGQRARPGALDPQLEIGRRAFGYFHEGSRRPGSLWTPRVLGEIRLTAFVIRVSSFLAFLGHVEEHRRVAGKLLDSCQPVV